MSAGFYGLPDHRRKAACARKQAQKQKCERSSRENVRHTFENETHSASFPQPYFGSQPFAPSCSRSNSDQVAQ